MNLSTIESPTEPRVGETVSSPLWRGLLLVACSGGLTALSWPSLPFGWLAWIALVPLGWCLRAASPRRGFIFGGLFGWGFWFGVIWWVQLPLREILKLSPILALTLTFLGCAFLALPYAISGWLACLGPRDSHGLWRTFKTAAIFMVVTSWFPRLFDVNITHSQFQNLRALQILDLGGTPLLLFVIFWVNWLIVEILASIKDGFKAIAKPAIALVATVTLLLGYGEFRLADFREQMKTAPEKNWFTVGAIQPNIPILVPPERQPAPIEDRTNDFFSALQQATAFVEKHPEIDLLAFPENPEFFIFNTDEKRRTALADMILETGKPVVLNASLLDSKQLIGGEPGIYNVNVFVNSTAFVTNSYRKMMLVPLIENIPGETVFPWLRKLFPESLGIIPGAKPVVFDVKPNVHVIPLVCYEGTSASFTRRFVKLGGNIVVNLINDSWFLRTPGAICHMALAPFRAVEFRVPFVRVTNSGIGAFVQPTGEIIPGSRTALFEKTASAFPLYIPAKRSFYAKYGDWFLALLTFTLVGSFVLQARRFFLDRRVKSQTHRRRKKIRTYYS